MIEEKLKELGLLVPPAPKPLAAYIPAMKVGNFVFTSGQVPIEDGKIIYSGKVGKDLSEQQACKAAELCLINCLSAVKSVISNLDNISKIVKLTVFVNSAEGFTNQPKVANGASGLLEKIFGENGKHVRSAVGVNELPLNSAVEIELIALVK
ncbi:MAG: RidA family protein [Ignavibacteria bacterium]|nr:RidA family protein [Ignavibacteria bacterium]MBT8380893.1 RidA family protein [Ignavibacteria bacterium]MBT8391028.1 RidA family protein [Ignavibacteria bacterium]NNJ54176.1 RidA family protein [Ignavibacteriaceae bacterium]NNL20683.1 RidA family protein [Ignavibacteriaceae bacterium]